MEPAAQHSIEVPIVEGDGDKFVIWENRGVKEHKESIVRSFNGSDVTVQSRKRGSKFLSRLPKYPPAVAISRATILVSLRLNKIGNTLENCWKSVAYLSSVEPQEIDHHQVARPLSQITPISVRANVGV
jgi:hypothetical protein